MSHRARRSARFLLVGLVLATNLLVATAAASAEAPAPAGRNPSSISKEVCSTKAQTEIADVLGVKAKVAKPTWRQHLYTCAYRYKTGAMVLSVKELSSWNQTYGYFDGLGKSLHKTTTIYQLGEGAFRVRNGSVIVRKDWKVLLVNVAGLPKRFGQPYSDVAGVALSVAGVILGCWNGD